MTATGSKPRSKTHWRGYVLCLVAAAISMGLAIWNEDQRVDFMSQWPDPYVDPQAYGLPPETATLSRYELALRLGWDEASRISNRMAGASSQYDNAERRARQIADRRDAFAFSALALLLLPFVIHGLAIFMRRANERLERAVDKAAPRVAKATAAVLSGAAKAPSLLQQPGAISRGNLSTADELRKWSDLRNEGLISEEEFLKMRAKILG